MELKQKEDKPNIKTQFNSQIYMLTIQFVMEKSSLDLTLLDPTVCITDKIWLENAVYQINTNTDTERERETRDRGTDRAVKSLAVDGEFSLLSPRMVLLGLKSSDRAWGLRRFDLKSTARLWIALTHTQPCVFTLDD